MTVLQTVADIVLGRQHLLLEDSNTVAHLFFYSLDSFVFFFKKNEFLVEKALDNKAHLVEEADRAPVTSETLGEAEARRRPSATPVGCLLRRLCTVCEYKAVVYKQL